MKCLLNTGNCLKWWVNCEHNRQDSWSWCTGNGDYSLYSQVSIQKKNPDTDNSCGMKTAEGTIESHWDQLGKMSLKHAFKLEVHEEN